MSLVWRRIDLGPLFGIHVGSEEIRIIHLFGTKSFSSGHSPRERSLNAPDIRLIDRLEQMG